jgi:hypothetical protein
MNAIYEINNGLSRIWVKNNGPWTKRKERGSREAGLSVRQEFPN